MADRASVIQAWSGGHLTYQEVSVRLGISRSAVAGHVRRHRGGRNGTKAVRAVTTEQVEAALTATGNNRLAAGRMLGVSARTVAKYANRPANPRFPNRAWDLATRHVCYLIERSRLTLEEIADRAGVGWSTLRRWRQGRKVGTPIYIQWVREAIKREETN